MNAKRKRRSDAKADPQQHEPDGLDRIDRPLSLTAQVERTLRAAINDGIFTGNRLPTSLELAEQLGVSRETVRLALESLQQEGLLVKHRRRGTFLNPPEVPQRLPVASRTIGYLQGDFSNERGESEAIIQGVSGAMFEGALGRASEAGYHVLAKSARIANLNDSLLDLLAHGQLRGVIFASIAEQKILKRLTGMNIPAVLLDHDLHLPKFSSVRPDTYGGTQLAVEHLAQLGHRRIAVAQWHQEDLNPWQVRGYREGMRSAGLRCRRAWELSVAVNRAGAASVVQSILDTSPRPTAVICFNNALANFVLEEAINRQLRVPEDLSIVGGGGSNVIGLTCVQLDWQAMGRRAMELLLGAIDSEEVHTPAHEIVSYTLQPGKTTGGPEAS
ncbi:GntR family transcriptional regulator [Bremerella sp. P1]|uniref:GntR family transcriptional regulator n=1 Tax=Bremerella sp. P1 TaxID=3026424 RepID=UPI0023682724|nr:GntR family transcriptional regulator [Bremerella sp. P1]WDI42154.1 GntR family transcriptional regulator [Bremerella sp. P1]